MSGKSKVAVLFTKPESVLLDYGRLRESTTWGRWFQKYQEQGHLGS